MDAKTLEDNLVTVKRTIDVMRKAGIPDQRIIKTFGLSNVELGDTTLRVYEAILNKTITSDMTLYEMRDKLGFKSHPAVLYHLNKLKKYGYTF